MDDMICVFIIALTCTVLFGYAVQLTEEVPLVMVVTAMSAILCWIILFGLAFKAI